MLSILFCLQYSGSVDENVADVVVMRIKALDKDLVNSENWQTIYIITSGNDDHLFSIETDKKTNEGILKLVKVFMVFLFSVSSVEWVPNISYCYLSPPYLPSILDQTACGF